MPLHNNCDGSPVNLLLNSAPMSNGDRLQKEISSWIQDSLENENIKDLKIVITGTTEKGEGYLGDIIFVKVVGLTKSTNEDIEWNLVIKMGKKNEVLRARMPLRDVFQREIFMYSRVFPEFRKFQQEKGVTDIFDSFPKCYNTIFLENVEALVLDNLKALGFELHDRQVPLNDSHIKLILYNYAKFHAISFAMRDQNRERFETLTTNCKRIKFFKGSKNLRVYNDLRLKDSVDLIRKKDQDLADLLCKVFKRSITNVMAVVLDDNVKEHVIVHGDCWNNNFMFKYENEDKKNPSEVAILDWQVSCLHSPVLDLSYFLYIVSDTEQVAKFDEYLRFYYANLSEFITELSSDPEKMFPFATLIDHWQKYSVYGIINVITLLDVMLSDKDTALSFDDLVSDDSNVVDWVSNIKPKNPDTYKSRVLATVRHYCSGIKNSI